MKLKSCWFLVKRTVTRWYISQTLLRRLFAPMQNRKRKFTWSTHRAILHAFFSLNSHELTSWCQLKLVLHNWPNNPLLKDGGCETLYSLSYTGTYMEVSSQAWQCFLTLYLSKTLNSKVHKSDVDELRYNKWIHMNVPTQILGYAEATLNINVHCTNYWNR